MPLEDAFIERYRPPPNLRLGDPRFNSILNQPTDDAITQPSHSVGADLAHLLRFGSDRTLEDTTRDVNRFIARDPTMTNDERRNLVSSFFGVGNVTRIPNPIRAYHSSPHRIEGPFRFDRINTGEGTQTQGYGFYFSGGEEPFYRVPRPSESMQIGDFRLVRPPRGDRAGQLAYDELTGSAGDIDAAINRLSRLPDYNFLRERRDQALTILNEWRRHGARAGHSYEVNLHVEPHQLLPEGARPPRTLEEANRLTQSGIFGRRYHSADSLGGNFNHVIWNPEVIEILRRYGLLGPAVGIGAAGLAGRPR